MSQDTPAPAVSVVIPHYNDLANLQYCLQLLAAQTMARDSFEIVVADNNSACGIDAVTAACGDFARVVPAPLQGAAEARNAAVRASRGAILAFIDSDCRPAADWLEEGLKALRSADIVGGRVEILFADPDQPTPVEAFEKVFAFRCKYYIERLKFAVTANMFVRHATFDRVGHFRPDVSEDRDWGNRAADMGFSLLYADRAFVGHPARRDWAELARKWRRIVSETYMLKKNRPYSGIKWILYCVTVLFSAPIHIYDIFSSVSISGFRLKFAASHVLFCQRFYRFYIGMLLYFCDYANVRKFL